jgi:cytochrome P450
MSTTASPPKYDLLSPEFFADPHPTFRKMRAEDPVYWHPQLEMWFLTRHDDIRRLVDDLDFSTERTDQYGRGAPPALKEKLEVINDFLYLWMVFADPPRHTRIRSLVTKAFAPRVIQGLRPFVQDLARKRIEAARAAGGFDLIKDFAYPLPSAVIAEILKIPPEDMDTFKAWTDDVMMLLGPGVSMEQAVERAHRGVVGLKGYFQKIIDERRQRPGDDVLSTLITARDVDEVLSAEELVATCSMLLVGGHETATYQIGNAIVALLRNPAQLALLRDRPDLLESAIEESLRYNGAVFQVMRRAKRDIDLQGTVIPAGQCAFGLLHAGNRDPAKYPDPDRFDITRPGDRHLAFGHGFHMCLGIALARMEVQVAVAELVALPGLALATDHYEWLPSLAVRGLKSLPVTFTR